MSHPDFLFPWKLRQHIEGTYTGTLKLTYTADPMAVGKSTRCIYAKRIFMQNRFMNSLVKVVWKVGWRLQFISVMLINERAAISTRLHMDNPRIPYYCIAPLLGSWIKLHENSFVKTFCIIFLSLRCTVLLHLNLCYIVTFLKPLIPKKNKIKQSTLRLPL